MHKDTNMNGPGFLEGIEKPSIAHAVLEVPSSGIIMGPRHRTSPRRPARPCASPFVVESKIPLCDHPILLQALCRRRPCGIRLERETAAGSTTRAGEFRMSVSGCPMIRSIKCFFVAPKNAMESPTDQPGRALRTRDTHISWFSRMQPDARFPRPRSRGPWATIERGRSCFPGKIFLKVPAWPLPTTAKCFWKFAGGSAGLCGHGD